MSDEDRVWEQVQELLTAAAPGRSPEVAFREAMGFPQEEASLGELQLALTALQAGDWPPPASSAREYDFEWDGDGMDGWIRARSHKLSQPMDFRIGMVRGRPRIVGLRIDNGTELTADTLRQPRLAEMLSAFLGAWDPSGPDYAGVKFKEHYAVKEWWLEMRELLATAPKSGASEVRARQGQAPDRAALDEFARVYLSQLQEAHGAISRTARQLHISRTTAYRWRAACEELGLLPKSEGTD